MIKGGISWSTKILQGDDVHEIAYDIVKAKKFREQVQNQQPSMFEEVVARPRGIKTVHKERVRFILDYI